MTFIDADDDVVSDLLASTLELLAESGGWLHPEATVVARDGQLSLECTADDDEPLLVIPREAFVRVDAITWGDDPLTMAISALPDDLGDIETSMAYVQAALHNQTGKLEWLLRTHPGLAPLPDAIVDRMRRLVPGFRATEMTPVDVLFSDRCLRVDLGDGRGSQRVLVPILDLLNHHPRGAQACWRDEAFSVTTTRPFGTSECALDYGHERDAMEMAAVYGFVDTGAGVAHLPVTRTDVPGIGIVSVVAAGRQATGALAPLTVERIGNETRISHLTFTTDAVTMQALVDELTQAAGWDAAASRAAVQTVGARAREKTLELRDLCVGDDDVMAVIRGAAARQGEVLASALAALETG